MLPPLSHVTFADNESLSSELVIIKLQFKFEEAFAGLGVIFISVMFGAELTVAAITVKLLEQVVIPSSDPSFGVMQACQTSLTFVSCCTILFVWFLYNACTCCADNVMLYSLMCMNLLFHYILG